MKKSSITKQNKEIIGSIHEIINELKLTDSRVEESAEVARGVFAVIAASSSEDPAVKIAAISGMVEIDNIGDSYGWTK